MSDPAAGKFEMPGGHLELGETARQAAMREWQEETGLNFPDGEWSGGWVSANGIYEGFVLTVASEADIDLLGRRVGSDPDGDVDGAETLAWWDPADLPGNSAVRSELLADIEAVMAALTPPCCGRDCCADGCCGGAAGCQCGPAPVAKCSFCPACDSDLDDAGNCMDWLERGERGRQRLGIDGTPGDAQDIPHPFVVEGGHAACAACWLDEPAAVHLGPAPVVKAGGSDPKDGSKAEVWPGWRLADQAAAYWAPLVTAAAASTLSASLLDRMATAYLAANPGQDGAAPGKQARNEAAYGWLVAWLATAGVTLDFAGLTAGMLTDGYLIGASSAESVTNGAPVDLGGWSPGGTSAAEDGATGLGLGDALAAMLAARGAVAVPAITGGILAAIARHLAGTDGDGDKGKLAAALGAIVAGAALATGLVLTAIFGASARGAQDYYAGNVTTDLSWVTDPTLQNCAICLANEASDPRPLGEPWPSGDVFAPAHDRCGCALVL